MQTTSSAFTQFISANRKQLKLTIVPKQFTEIQSLFITLLSEEAKSWLLELLERNSKGSLSNADIRLYRCEEDYFVATEDIRQITSNRVLEVTQAQ